MTTTGQEHADLYLRELRLAAKKLPSKQRGELVAEIESHIADGLAEADSEAAVRNLLDDLGDPEDIVDAALPGGPPGGVPTRGGGVALTLGLVGAVVALVPVFGAFVAIPLGLGAVVLGVTARKRARRAGAPSGMAIGGIIAGVVAITVPVLILSLLAPGVQVETEPVLIPMSPDTATP